MSKVKTEMKSSTLTILGILANLITSILIFQHSANAQNKMNCEWSLGTFFVKKKDVL